MNFPPAYEFYLEKAFVKEEPFSELLPLDCTFFVDFSSD